MVANPGHDTRMLVRPVFAVETHPSGYISRWLPRMIRGTPGTTRQDTIESIGNNLRCIRLHLIVYPGVVLP
jgi:hypothetical protein